MIITLDVTFWDMIGRLADITWLLTFATADIWVIASGLRWVRKKIRKVSK